MRLFLDASVLLAASASANGASREIFRRSTANGWILIATPYVIDEVVRNIRRLPVTAHSEWQSLRGGLLILKNVLTLDRAAVFGPAKDRPILFGALAWADVLLTLDRADFGAMMDRSFYGLPVLKPGRYLARERTEGRLR